MERTSTVWTVCYDNGANHNCTSFEEAIQFALEVRGFGGYGSPTRIEKRTRYTKVTHETAFDFMGGDDEH